MGKWRRRRQGAGLIVLAAFIVLLALLLCGSLWYFQLAGKTISTFGYEWMAAETGEMEPDIPKGSLLLLLPASEGGILPGAVVVTGRESGQGGLCRILEETGDGYLAKTDRATAAGEIPWEAVTHRVGIVLPWLGAAWGFLLTIPGTAIVAGLPLIGLVLAIVRHLRRRRRWAEEAPGLRRKVTKISSHREDDRREHFVDVTEVYTGSGPRKPYSSPLRRAMGQEEEEPEELPDKFSDLDFNPLMDARHSSPLETVEIPDGPDILRLFLNGTEEAAVSLTGPQQISLKPGRWRIDISIAASEEEGEGAGT